MIFYFSGLGNSKYIADSLKIITGESTYDIRNSGASNQVFSGKTLGFVFPVYSWGVPKIVLDFIGNLSSSFFKSVKDHSYGVWMVCTCGDETGNTSEMLSECLEQHGLKLNGSWSIIMPNTYVLLPGFDVDSKELEIKKLENAQNKVVEIGKKINNGNWEWNLHRGSFPFLRTRLLYPLFVRWGMSPQKWHHSDLCIKCGKCKQVCPMNNITFNQDGPVWMENCISCLACYHCCPKHAVEYGAITKKKGQYVCPLNI